MRPWRMPTTVSTNGRLPWTRRNALDFWSRSIGALSLVATGAIALGAAFQGTEGAPDYTIFGLGLVLALPVLWIAIARLAEKRYLSRPPKRFLATALGLDAGGIVLVAASVLLIQSQALDAASIFTAGGLLEGCGTLLLLVWFVAVRLVAPTDDHMHAL